MGTNYKKYRIWHEIPSKRLLSAQEIAHNRNLLVQLHSLMESVDMAPPFTELEENLGYRYNIKTGCRHLFTQGMLDSLLAIKNRNLTRLTQLHANGHVMRAYSAINARLAVLYDSVVILLYLIEERMVNRDLNEIVGQLATVSTLKALPKYLFDRDVKNRGLTLLDADEIMRHTHQKSYEHNGSQRLYGIDNYTLREYITKI
tara:strand:- start:61 stop:666 length:606 start_codon:yes stop_codon:yes gene_type:complete